MILPRFKHFERLESEIVNCKINLISFGELKSSRQSFKGKYLKKKSSGIYIA